MRTVFVFLLLVVLLAGCNLHSLGGYGHESCSHHGKDWTECEYDKDQCCLRERSEPEPSTSNTPNTPPPKPVEPLPAADAGAADAAID